MADLLVVDDNEDIASLVQAVLAGEGHAVRVVHDGAAGLLALDERRPDLVLLDIEMPVLDGPGMVARMFLENMGRENVPIVLMSAAPDLPRIAKRVGTPYSIAKPFDPDPFLALVARALSERKLPRPGLETR